MNHWAFNFFLKMSILSLPPTTPHRFVHLRITVVVAGDVSSFLHFSWFTLIEEDWLDTRIPKFMKYYQGWLFLRLFFMGSFLHCSMYIIGNNYLHPYVGAAQQFGRTYSWRLHWLAFSFGTHWNHQWRTLMGRHEVRMFMAWRHLIHWGHELLGETESKWQEKTTTQPDVATLMGRHEVRMFMAWQHLI